MDATAANPSQRASRCAPLDVRVAHTLAAVRAAALELLEAQDARSITISQLCKKASISRPTFYQHYSGLDDVYADIVRQELSRTAREFENFEGSGIEKPLERLIAFVHTHGMGNLATVGNRQLASRVRPIVELWLAERVARAAFNAELDALDPEQWMRTYFVAGGLMTVLRQQAADSPASGVGTEEMARSLQRTMSTVLRTAAS